MAATAGQPWLAENLYSAAYLVRCDSLRTSVMAFPICRSMIPHTLGRLGGLSLLGPWTSIRRFASLSDRPILGSACRASTTLLDRAVCGANGSAWDVAVLPVSVFWIAFSLCCCCPPGDVDVVGDAFSAMFVDLVVEVGGVEV